MNRAGRWAHRLVRYAALTCTLGAAFALKYHYSHASAEDLAWVLQPTQMLVSLVTGAELLPEAGVGFISADRRFAVVSSCAGVNFMIAAFVMLSVWHGWRARSWGHAARELVRAAVTAYVATLVVNSLRIAVAVQLYALGDRIHWIGSDEAHLWLGVVVYFGALLALVPRRRPAGAVALLWPTACYVGMAVVVPIVNALARGAPVPLGLHTVVAITVPVALAGVVWGVAWLGWADATPPRSCGTGWGTVRSSS